MTLFIPRPSAAQSLCFAFSKAFAFAFAKAFALVFSE
jgi:hypothetical protein